METGTHDPPMTRDRLAIIEEMFVNSCHDDPHWGYIWELFRFAESQQPIPVSERLPEDHSSVLTWLNDLDDGYSWGWQTAYFKDGIWWRAAASSLEDDVSPYVTHWLPLPPKPE